MQTLIELKNEHLKSLEKQAAEAEARKAAQEKAKKAELNALFPEVCKVLAERENVDPAELARYGGVRGQRWAGYELQKVVFYLELPDHAPIEVSLPANLSISGIWFVGNKHFDSLGQALVGAARVYQAQKEYEQREAENEARYQQEQAQAAAQAKNEADERQRLFDQIAGNKAALLLLRTFVEITKDSEAFDEQLAGLAEASGMAEDYHSRELARARTLAENAKREAAQAQDRARELEYEKDDLESKLKKSKRSW